MTGVRIQHLDAIPVAVVRRQTRASDLSRVVPECCGLVWNALRAQGVKGGRHVALYLDDTIRVEIGAEVSAPFVEQDGLVRSATPAGTVACATHFGPYDRLKVAHEAIRAFCADGHHRLAGPSWEIYGHWQPAWDADPSQIRTDVCYLLSA
jgi:effector-binding domain-containing protein